MNVVPWPFRTAGVGAVPGAGTAHVGDGLRVLPGPRRGPVGTVRLRVLVAPDGECCRAVLAAGCTRTNLAANVQSSENVCRRVMTASPGVEMGATRFPALIVWREVVTAGVLFTEHSHCLHTLCFWLCYGQHCVEHLVSFYYRYNRIPRGMHCCSNCVGQYAGQESAKKTKAITNAIY